MRGLGRGRERGLNARSVYCSNVSYVGFVQPLDVLTNNPRGSVERNNETDHEKGQRHDTQRLAPREPNGNDTGSKLPSCSTVELLALFTSSGFQFQMPSSHSFFPGPYVLESVRYPIRNKARHTPFPRLPRHRIEIFIRPVAHGISISTPLQALPYHNSTSRPHTTQWPKLKLTIVHSPQQTSTWADQPWHADA